MLVILEAIREILTPGQLETAEELVRAGEPGIALEIVCENLYEDDLAIAAGTLELMAKVSREMGIDPKYWEMLRTDPAANVAQ